MAPRLRVPAAALKQIPWMAAKLSARVDFGFKTFQEGATECVVREGAVDIGAIMRSSAEIAPSGPSST
jgi:hypothetical protein